ncbi:hypothetical protein [Aquimarina sp. RZ0]|uniref:hypothetical protein n=1 Tax=Aquimarina sp. RZ0 TaxID=2607730 RepID=UPI0011F3755B|nr:hypothetical protein [Aquimarina sp. RZ0]KAA1244550.1 hypothetical protein F0000_16320 [Aquimarina sp. RZ0]
MGIFSKKKRGFIQFLNLKFEQDLESESIKSNKTEKYTDYIIDASENFDLFDYAIIRNFEHKKDLSGNSSFNLIMGSHNKSATIDKLTKIVDSIVIEYGKDRNGNGKWTEKDSRQITDFWLGREWIINSKGKSISGSKLDKNCYQINLHFDSENGISLSILGASLLMK